MPTDVPTLLTIGHSNLEFSEFVELLRRHGTTAVADVRSQPGGRLHHFHRGELEQGLRDEGIQYVFLGRELGARRDEPECYENDLAVYERIAPLPEFQKGLDRIRKGLQRHRIALMCAEKEPLECHRTILICRHLRGNEIVIQHILSDGTLEDHAATERRLLRLTGEARTLFEPDLTDEELLERAYETRGREIAYRRQPEEVAR